MPKPCGFALTGAMTFSVKFTVSIDEMSTNEINSTKVIDLIFYDRIPSGSKNPGIPLRRE
jgi:hypothetical protein